MTLTLRQQDNVLALKKEIALKIERHRREMAAIENQMKGVEAAIELMRDQRANAKMAAPREERGQGGE